MHILINLIREYDKIGPISSVSITQTNPGGNLDVTICRAGGSHSRPSSDNPDITIKGWDHHPDIIRTLDCEYYPAELDALVLSAANYSQALDVLRVQDGHEVRYHYKPYNRFRAGDIPRKTKMINRSARI